MKLLSLPDWAFYPLMVLISVAMVYGSLSIRPPGGEVEFEENILLVEGPALANFFNGPGTRAQFIPDFPGGPVARLSADGSLDALGRQSAGTGLYLPADYARMAAGHPVQITILMRAADEDLTDFRLAYFVLEEGSSGWQTRTVSNDFEEVTYTYTPSETSTRGQHILGFWPDPEGRGHSILIRRITMEVQP